MKKTILTALTLAGCGAALALPAPADAAPICLTPDLPCVYGVEENAQAAHDYVTYTIAHPERICTVPLLAGPICVTTG